MLSEQQYSETINVDAAPRFAIRFIFSQYVLLTLAVALTFVFVGITDAQKVFVRTGFEEFATGNPPKDWEAIGGNFEVSGDTVKTDKKALAILVGGADGDGLGIPIETENPIISVEFWVYIEGGGRSFNLKVATADGFGENNGCTYINWDAGVVRLYDGGHGNLLVILKPIHGNMSTLLLMWKKANLIFT